MAGQNKAGISNQAALVPDVPDAPVIGTATDVGTSRAYNNGAATVTVSPTVTGGVPTTYTVTSSPGGYTATGASPVTVTGLQSATSYTFTAKGNNGTANGSASSASSNSITATTVPQAPTIGTVTVTNTTTVSVPFTNNATGGKAITSYTITSSPSIALTYSGTTSPFTVTGAFAEGTSYTFTIAATNANGTSAASSASNSVAPSWVSGGTLTSDATYYYRKFTGSGTLGIAGTNTLTADVLIVAGGGGVSDAGNGWAVGGGGGGGLKYLTNQSISSSTSVGVGGGGGAGGSGTGSSFGATSCSGGGYASRGPGGNGGSGGGGGASYPSVWSGGTGTAGQGNNGAAGNYSISNVSGGGGGAGSAASTSTAGSGSTYLLPRENYLRLRYYSH